MSEERLWEDINRLKRLTNGVIPEFHQDIEDVLNKLDLYKEVIEEVREYAKRFDIERLHENCEHNLAEVLEDLLQILDKGVKNVQGSMETS